MLTIIMLFTFITFNIITNINNIYTIPLCGSRYMRHMLSVKKRLMSELLVKGNWKRIRSEVLYSSSTHS